MKVICPYCGIHFPEDFSDTLKCGWWEARMQAKYPKAVKKAIWDYTFQAPIDRVYNETGWILRVMVSADKPPKQQLIKDEVDGYAEWSDEERKAYQKGYEKAKVEMTKEGE